jgi:prepilin-type processing-associated H-X9-DG protein
MSADKTVAGTTLKRGLGIAVILILVALIIPGISSAPSAGRRSQCLNNIRNIAIALHNYASHYGSLPPAYIADENGRPMHSWRVLILPYVVRSDIYSMYRFDEPWDGPENSKLHDLVVNVFACPEDGSRLKRTDTSYVAVVGPETIWPGESGFRLDDVTDGLSQTLLVVEIAKSGIHWMEPRDLHFSQMATTINAAKGQCISSPHKGMASVAFADGRVRVLHDSILADTIASLLTVRGGETIPGDR